MVKNPSYFTLSRAAKEAGKSKSVIHKAIKDGQLSVLSKESSGFQIDPAELFRVFPKNTKKTEQEPEKPTKTDIPNEQYRTADYAVYQRVKITEYTDIQVEVRVLREKLTLRDQTISDLRQERDRWQHQAETLLLTHHSETATTNEEGEGTPPQLPTIVTQLLEVVWWIVCIFASGLGLAIAYREFEPIIQTWIL